MRHKQEAEQGRHATHHGALEVLVPHLLRVRELLVRHGLEVSGYGHLAVLGGEHGREVVQNVDAARLRQAQLHQALEVGVLRVRLGDLDLGLV